MDQWFYSVSEERKGPVSGEGLRKLLETGEIPLASPVWKEGMTDWVSASSIAELQPSPYASSVSDQADGMDWSGYTPEGPQVRPWTRYWARTFDTYLFSTIAGFIIGLVYPAIIEMGELFLTVIFTTSFSFLEPLLLSVFGTTPFKALLNVRVRKNDGSKPTYMEALGRSLKVFVFGQGLGVPVIAIFTCIGSYRMLSRRGITKWDSELGFTVSHRKVGWWRWLIFVLSVLAFSYITTLGE